MTHNAAVQIVVELAPEISKSGAETTLLNYARKQDLPPAQLEKLAQTYNTLLTVSHIEKAADRGSAPVGKIDVPVFVTSYAIDDRQPAALKSAARESHHIDSVDLMSALRRDVAGPALSKAAFAPMASEDTKLVKASREELEEVMLDKDIDAMFAMEAIANTFAKSAAYLDLASAEEDAMHARRPAMVKRAVDWLCRATAKEASRFEGQLRSRSIPLMSDAGSILVELTDAFSMREVVKLAAQSIATAPGPDSGMKELISMDHPSLSPVEEEELRDLYEEEPVILSPEEEQRGIADAEEKEKEHQEKEKENSETPGTTPSSPPRDEDKLSKGPSSGPLSSPDSGRLGRIAAVLGAPIREVGNAISSSAVAADNLLEGIVSKERFNGRQRQNDVSLADIRRSIALQRMIGTDAVLREKDPREILEIYNAVAQSNPDVAADMARVRLILREATSYDGVTLDSQKQLTDIRKGTAEAEAKEVENTKRQYGIGNATASLLSSKMKS